MAATAVVCGLLAMLWPAASPVLAAAGPVATISSDGASVWWTPIVETAGVTLAISDPSGSVQTFSFAADELPTLSLTDADGQALPDGSYTWELRIRLPLSRLSGAVAAGPEEAAGGAWASGLRRMTSEAGHFTIAAGMALIPEPDEGAANNIATAEDQLVPDDLIVDGRGCIGLGCTNNEAFVSEALRLKQSIVRLRFEDTSTAAGFPATDWQLRANDAGSGGVNLFSLEDLTAGTVPLTVKGGAPSSSLYIDNDGDVGLGTAVPAAAVHVARNASPSIALDQTGAPARQWQLIGDGTSFTVRDNTAGTNPLVVGTTIVGTVDSGDSGTGSTRPANSAFIQVLRHDTDCTLLGNPGGGFKAGELCYEEDSDRLFVCEPTDGVCNTAGEWRAASSGAGLTVREVDGTPSVAGSSIVELDQGDGFVVSGAAGTARVDWTPQPDQIALGTHTTGNYAGSSSEGGAATAASAFAADPADCAAGQWAAGITASGAAAGCTPDDDTPDSDAEVPDAVTVTGTVDAKDAGSGTTRPANAATIEVLRHATDCTILSGAFKAGEPCFEKDSNRLFVCKPTAGDCDTAQEWVLVSDGALDRLVNWGFTPDESWKQAADEVSWTGYATYTGTNGFVTPGFSIYTNSSYQVAHNGGVKSAFRYRPAATSSSIVLRARTAITYVTAAGIMIDNGVDAGDGNGATSFYRVYMTQSVLAGAMTVIEEYRTGGGAVQTNVGPTIPYGEFTGLQITCASGGVWSAYTCAPATFGESQQAIQFTGGSPFLSWTPVRVGLYAKFSATDFGRRAIWDWYDEATN